MEKSWKHEKKNVNKFKRQREQLSGARGGGWRPSDKNFNIILIYKKNLSSCPGSRQRSSWPSARVQVPRSMPRSTFEYKNKIKRG